MELKLYPLQDSDLQACYAFPIPENEIPRLTLTHNGIDGWRPEWIRVLLADSTYLMCYDGEVTYLKCKMFDNNLAILCDFFFFFSSLLMMGSPMSLNVLSTQTE